MALRFLRTDENPLTGIPIDVYADETGAEFIAGDNNQIEPYFKTNLAAYKAAQGTSLTKAQIAEYQATGTLALFAPPKPPERIPTALARSAVVRGVDLAAPQPDLFGQIQDVAGGASIEDARAAIAASLNTPDAEAGGSQLAIDTSVNVPQIMPAAPAEEKKMPWGLGALKSIGSAIGSFATSPVGAGLLGAVGGAGLIGLAGKPLATLAGKGIGSLTGRPAATLNTTGQRRSSTGRRRRSQPRSSRRSRSYSRPRNITRFRASRRSNRRVDTRQNARISRLEKAVRRLR